MHASWTFSMQCSNARPFHQLKSGLTWLSLWDGRRVVFRSGWCLDCAVCMLLNFTIFTQVSEQASSQTQGKTGRCNQCFQLVIHSSRVECTCFFFTIHSIQILYHYDQLYTKCKPRHQKTSSSLRPLPSAEQSHRDDQDRAVMQRFGSLYRDTQRQALSLPRPLAFVMVFSGSVPFLFHTTAYRHE